MCDVASASIPLLAPRPHPPPSRTQYSPLSDGPPAASTFGILLSHLRSRPFFSLLSLCCLSFVALCFFFLILTLRVASGLAVSKQQQQQQQQPVCPACLSLDPAARSVVSGAKQPDDEKRPFPAPVHSPSCRHHISRREARLVGLGLTRTQLVRWSPIRTCAPCHDALTAGSSIAGIEYIPRFILLVVLLEDTDS